MAMERLTITNKDGGQDAVANTLWRFSSQNFMTTTTINPVATLALHRV